MVFGRKLKWKSNMPFQTYSLGYSIGVWFNSQYNLHSLGMRKNRLVTALWRLIGDDYCPAEPERYNFDKNDYPGEYFTEIECTPDQWAYLEKELEFNIQHEWDESKQISTRANYLLVVIGILFGAYFTDKCSLGLFCVISVFLAIFSTFLILFTILKGSPSRFKYEYNPKMIGKPRTDSKGGHWEVIDRIAFNLDPIANNDPEEKFPEGLEINRDYCSTLYVNSQRLLVFNAAKTLVIRSATIAIFLALLFLALELGFSEISQSCYQSIVDFCSYRSGLLLMMVIVAAESLHLLMQGL